jgi:serine/threonine-protein kinase
MNDLDYEGAQGEFLKAIELNPSYSTAHHWYGLLLMDLGKPKEAFAEMRRAQEADPLSPPITVNIGGFYWIEGNDSLAQEWLEKASEIERRYVPAYFIRSMFYAAKGMREKALENLRLGWAFAVQTDSPSVISSTGYIYALLGMNSEANRSLDALIEKQEKSRVDPSEIAAIYAGLKNYDEFFECAFRAIAQKSSRIGIYRTSPLFADIRADPRFPELLKAARVPS